MLRSIRWRIAIPYVILTVLATLALTAVVSNQLRAAQLVAIESQLAGEARLLADRLARDLSPDTDTGALDQDARRWAELVGARVTIIGRDGRVLGESHQDSASMDNHLSRAEVRQALQQGSGTSVRFSSTLDQETMYVAVPISSPQAVVGVARVSLPVSLLEANVARLRRAILAAALVIALMVIGLGLLIAERIARPIRRLTIVADQMAEGDFSARLTPTTGDEVGQLTSTFNKMAAELQDKLGTLADERGRLATILANMADGVLITDTGGQVQLINPAATLLLESTESRALGRSFAGVVRHHQIIELWQQCRTRQTSQVGAVEIDRRGIFWQVIITPFRETDTQGYLVIIQDLSRIRRLETVRRDFISNISHELRTPLASLKALVDTLRDGALDDPPAAAHFLDSMEAEVDSLTQMVQELLELSRIESGQVALRLEPTTVAEVVAPPTQRLQLQAERSQVTLTLQLPQTLPVVWADPDRLQQVVTNLVHNAIKFTPAGGQVVVRAYVAQDDQIPAAVRPEPRPRFTGPWPVVVVEVADTGVGIPEKDLPRIFERFYKADRARSRGGTGLGLSIARHLVQGHGGAIWAQSTEGQGSIFCFSIPVVNQTFTN
jgi:two-component system phosphate regulon sensor histidine kinase PhoR